MYNVGDKVRITEETEEKEGFICFLNPLIMECCIGHGGWPRNTRIPSDYKSISSNFYWSVSGCETELLEPAKPNLFKVGDELARNGDGKRLIISHISENNVIAEINEMDCKIWTMGYLKNNFKLINSNSGKSAKTIMSNIREFAKNLILPADEKLLREQGLKDECGTYTEDAKNLVLDKIIEENEEYLVEIAEKKKAEDKEKK